MDQTPNTPTSNQNNESPLGFAQYQTFMSMLTSPQIPNQPTFTSPQVPSPPMHFPTFYPQPHNFQNNYYSQSPNFGGGSSSMPQFQTQASQQVVEETQEPEPTGRKEKATKKPKTSKGKTTKAQTTSIPWTEDELVALADAWCKTSKDGVKGNSQKADAYWEQIRKLFHSLLKAKDYRNTDAVSSKWGQIRTKLTKFNDIYNKIDNAKPSGWNEMQILLAAKSEYKATEKQDFNLEKVWRRIRNDPKWKKVESGTRTASGSKRSRGADSIDVSDGHVNIDLNAGSDAFPDDFEDDVEVVGSPLRRPPGRDKAKRIARFGDDQEKKTNIERKWRDRCVSTSKKRRRRRS